MTNDTEYVDGGIDELSNEFDRMTNAEVKAFKAFQFKYQQMHPVPKKEVFGLGWQFAAAIVTSVSAAILAAFRTAQAFYSAAVIEGNMFFAGLEAISAVFAIEGSVILFAIQNTYRRRQTKSTLPFLGILVAFIISSLAGLFQSVNLINSQTEFTTLLDWTLIVSMGLGATVLAWFGGELLGVQLVHMEDVNKDASTRLESSMRSYRSRLIREWKKSNERLAISNRKSERYGTHEQNIRTQSEQKSFLRTNKENEQNYGEQKILIYKILDDSLSENGTIVGVSDIARAIARSRNPDGSEDGFEKMKGYISGVRKEWMKEQKITP